MQLFTKSAGGWYASYNCTVTGEVTVGELASFWFGAVVRGDVAAVTIGRRTNIQDNAVVHCDTDVPNVIGDDVIVGHGAIVHGKSVGNGSLIGMHATLLSRTVIGSQCLVAAGAVAPPDMVVPDRMMVVGVPAKILRPVKPEELDYMAWLARHYVELAQAHVEGKIKSVLTQS